VGYERGAFTNALDALEKGDMLYFVFALLCFALERNGKGDMGIHWRSWRSFLVVALFLSIHGKRNAHTKF
jgi:hypothetical protein